MPNQLARREATSITIYDPDEGLKTIAVAEAGERHWARAKDAGQLLQAVETKIKAQAEYVVWRDGVGPRRGGDRQSARARALSQNQDNALPDADPGNKVAERWRTSFCSKEDGRTAIDEEKLAVALNDARLRCVRICEQHQISTIRGTEGTGEFERYTPAQYVEAVKRVLGRIDLDPASSAKAQRVVQAERYFTARDDGLDQEWNGRVFLNPPYHRELAPRFIDKLVAEVSARRTTEAILLTNNSTDTEWFEHVAEACNGICFVQGRIKFLQPDGREINPTQGQMFIYFGRNLAKFERVFGEHGPCFRALSRTN